MKKTVITKNGLLESYKNLEDRSEFDFDYVFLTAGAAAICVLGFRMNSPSVIVGAMLVSPLLVTVVGSGASFFWKKWKTLSRNILALFLGIITAVVVGFVVSLFLPTDIGSSEIITRITSSSIDYFLVALFSGLTGTFAFFWPEILEAIAGVAISVALIPPVVMIGIGLSKLDAALISSSINIVFVNVLGILLGSVIAVAALSSYAKK